MLPPPFVIESPSATTPSRHGSPAMGRVGGRGGGRGEGLGWRRCAGALVAGRRLVRWHWGSGRCAGRGRGGNTPRAVTGGNERGIDRIAVDRSRVADRAATRHAR